MRVTLGALDEALNGAPFSEELDRMRSDIEAGRVPAQWREPAHRSLLPLGKWKEDW